MKKIILGLTLLTSLPSLAKNNTSQLVCVATCITSNIGCADDTGFCQEGEEEVIGTNRKSLIAKGENRELAINELKKQCSFRAEGLFFRNIAEIDYTVTEDTKNISCINI